MDSYGVVLCSNRTEFVLPTPRKSYIGCISLSRAVNHFRGDLRHRSNYFAIGQKTESGIDSKILLYVPICLLNMPEYASYGLKNVPTATCDLQIAIK